MVGDLRLGDYERDDGLRPQLLHRRQPMEPVRRPVLPVVGRDSDHRIEIPSELVDRVGDPADMGLRQVALERRRLDAVDRQSGKQLPVSAEGITVRREHGTAVLLDVLRELLDRGRWRATGDTARIEAP